MIIFIRISVFFLTIFSVYFCMSFLFLDANPFEWSKDDRLFFVVFGVPTGVLFATFPSKSQ